MLRLEFGDVNMERWKQSDEIPDITGGARPIRLHYGFYEDCLSYDAYKAAESVVVPTMIVQGDCDELVPLHQCQRLFEALSGPKRLEMVSGADHSFTKASDFHNMVGKLKDWLVRHLK